MFYILFECWLQDSMHLSKLIKLWTQDLLSILVCFMLGFSASQPPSPGHFYLSRFLKGKNSREYVVHLSTLPCSPVTGTLKSQVTCPKDMTAQQYQQTIHFVWLSFLFYCFYFALSIYKLVHSIQKSRSKVIFLIKCFADWEAIWSKIKLNLFLFTMHTCVNSKWIRIRNHKHRGKNMEAFL